MPSKNLIYALDFGTSNSLLAAADEERTYDPIPLDSKAKDPSILRSLLYFPDMSRCYYGTGAIREFLEHQGEGRLIRSIKKHLPIRSFVGTWIGDRPANLEDLIGFFLGEMRKRANEHFGQDVDRVVMGRPARFAVDDLDDNFAQHRLEEAARRAGFKSIEFCPEPLAAAYEFRQSLDRAKLVLVADFGGGTSDYTVVRMDRGEELKAEVLAIGGVPVAGDALDGAVMRHRLAPYFGSDISYTIPFSSNVLRLPSHLMERICSAADISLLGKRDVKEFLRNVQQWAGEPESKRKLDRLFCLIEEQQGFPLFESIEGVKRELSEQNAAPLIFDHPVIAIREILARVDFEAFIQVQVDRIMKALDETLAQAGVTAPDIDVVCCTGGTAKVPALRNELIQRFGPAKLDSHNHFHSVVKGLSERARGLARG